jgi:hypothetical protein
MMKCSRRDGKTSPSAPGFCLLLRINLETVFLCFIHDDDYYIARFWKLEITILRSPFSRLGLSKLSDEEFARAERLVLAYVEERKSITNREFRALTGLNYDQAVTFFNKMIGVGTLMRVGKTTAIKYIFPTAQQVMN